VRGAGHENFPIVTFDSKFLGFHQIGASDSGAGAVVGKIVFVGGSDGNVTRRVRSGLLSQAAERSTR